MTGELNKKALSEIDDESRFHSAGRSVNYVPQNRMASRDGSIARGRRPRTNLAALYDRLRAQVQPGSPQDLNTQKEIDKLRREELQLLARDATLVPESAPIQYRFGLNPWARAP